MGQGGGKLLPGSNRTHLRLVAAAGVFQLILAFHMLGSFWIDPQSSIDASYYHILASRLKAGLGFTEPFVWNFLKEYPSLTHPIDYWMPLAGLFYRGGKKVFPGYPEVFLNRFIWAALSTWVFLEALGRCGSWAIGLFAAVCLGCGGKFGYYVSTTDNIALYASLGLLFFSDLPRPDSVGRSFRLGLTSGLMALTRIEGLIFGAFALAFSLFRGSRAFTMLLLAASLSLVLAPWCARNMREIGVIWPSNRDSLFLQEYNDLFRPDAPRGADAFLSRGWGWIAEQKFSALRRNLLEFFFVPFHLILFPFFLAGLAELPGRWPFMGLFTVMWLLNGLLFSVQSVHGTAFHITAAFFPHISLTTALGIRNLLNRIFPGQPRKPVRIMAGVFSLFVLGFSIASGAAIRDSYDSTNKPYRDLLREARLNSDYGTTGTHHPILVHLLSGRPTICISPSGAPSPFLMADRYGMGSLILDNRYPIPSSAEIASSGWKTVSSTTCLLLLKRPAG